MVRKYGKKNNKEKSYDQNTFKKAVDEIKQGHSMKGTAKKYAIPYSNKNHKAGWFFLASCKKWNQSVG